MSNTNPGGSRASEGRRRIFGAANIARACREGKIPEVDKPNHSIADQPHQNSREQQRRLRQQARKANKNG
jgi:hypothetical protein